MAAGERAGSAPDAHGSAGAAAPRSSCYVLVESHTQGLALYQELKRAGLGVRIAPAPRGVAACCGMSLLADAGAEDAVRRAVEEGGLAHDRIVEVETDINPHRDRFC